MARGDFPRAARLFGAAVAVYEEIGTVDSLRQRIESTRAALGDDAFKLAWNEGHSMTLEDSTQYTLAASAPQSGPRASCRRLGCSARAMPLGKHQLYPSPDYCDAHPRISSGLSDGRTLVLLLTFFWIGDDFVTVPT